MRWCRTTATTWVIATAVALWPRPVCAPSELQGRYTIELFEAQSAAATKPRAALRGTLILLSHRYELTRVPSSIREKLEDEFHWTMFGGGANVCFEFQSEPPMDRGFVFSRRGLSRSRLSDSGQLEFPLSASPDAGYWVQLHPTRVGFEGEGQWGWGAVGRHEEGPKHLVTLSRTGKALDSDCDKMWSSKP